ncbi:transposase, partial [Komagataeibacter europaeus]|uniref:transposase n=1 Tax=Komagataeibacter europaeus TaxID=33995 RepID=UPI0022323B71
HSTPQHPLRTTGSRPHHHRRYGRFRDECLNETLLTSLMHACQILADWRADYNTVRPHIPNWMANTGPGRQTRVS